MDYAWNCSFGSSVAAVAAAAAAAEVSADFVAAVPVAVAAVAASVVLVVGSFVCYLEEPAFAALFDLLVVAFDLASCHSSYPCQA